RGWRRHDAHTPPPGGGHDRPLLLREADDLGRHPRLLRVRPLRGHPMNTTYTAYTAVFAAAVLALGAAVALLIHPAVLALVGAAVPIAYTDRGAWLGLWAPMAAEDLLPDAAEEAIR